MQHVFLLAGLCGIAGLAACSAAPPVAALAIAATAATEIAAASPPGTQAAITKVASGAQLFCAVASAGGPLTVGLISALDPANAPIAVTTKDWVDAACAAANGIPVSPPPAGQTVPSIAIPGPAAVVG